MPKLPRPSGQDMVRFLQARGFRVARIRGSHHVMENGGLRTTVPVHGGKILRIGTLRGILRDIDLDPSVFAEKW